MRGFNLKGIGPRSGGKIQVGVLKLELSLFAPARSLTFPPTNSLSFFSYSTNNRFSSWAILCIRAAKC